MSMTAQDWDRRYGDAELVWSTGPNCWVEQLLATEPPGRAVDIAAGEGRNALWLAGLGWDVLATDFSPVGVARARQRADALPEGARFRAEVADALDPVPDPPYDLALLCYLQLPADQLDQALCRAAEALAPGGLMVVVGHAGANLAGGTGGPQDPAVLYDPDTVEVALARLGLAVDEAGIRERHVDGASRSALDTVVTARRQGALDRG